MDINNLNVEIDTLNGRMSMNTYVEVEYFNPSNPSVSHIWETVLWRTQEDEDLMEALSGTELSGIKNIKFRVWHESPWGEQILLKEGSL